MKAIILFNSTPFNPWPFINVDFITLIVIKPGYSIPTIKLTIKVPEPIMVKKNAPIMIDKIKCPELI